MSSVVLTANQTLPSPRQVPILGSMATMLRLSTEPVTLFRDYYQRYGRISSLNAPKQKEAGVVLAFGPEFNKQVLSDPAVFHSPSLAMLGDNALTRLSSGLVTMNGERHRQQRRLMMPAFHKQAVTQYAELMVQYTADMLQSWKVGSQIDLMLELRRLVLRIVSQTLFGLDDPATNERLGNRINQWTQMINAPLNMLLPPLRAQLPRKSEPLEQELIALIGARRAAGAQGNDVLSMLIQTQDEDGTRMTDAELIGQLAILFIAGHETTVNALAWTLIMLARYPALRMELVGAVRSAIGEGTPTAEQAYGVPLLDYTIKETMRMLPPAVYTMRLAVEPFELGGYALPKDSVVVLSHYITHRMPEIYTEPDRFQPQRWEQLDVSPYEYLPFSAGSRMCIGASFASLEMRLVLAMLLTRVQVKPLGKVDYQIVGNILSPKGNVPCVVQAADEQGEGIMFAERLRNLVN